MLLLLPFLGVVLPMLLPMILLAVIVYVGGRALLNCWQSERPLRTKRAVTGLLLYPAGAYFLYRYTRYPAKVKHAFLVAAIIATVLAAHATSLVLPLMAVLGAVFLALFMAGTYAAEPEAATVKITPARSVGQRRLEVPSEDMRRLLEIEEARGEDERRLLLAREFNRLATEACGPAPLDRAFWPDRQRLGVLRVEIGVLRASAVETPAALRDPQDEVVDYADLRGAIDSLRGYVGMMLALDGDEYPDPEQLRRLARERGRIQAVQDQLLSRLQKS
ncbi:MAG TPA: hypothetical protein VFX74_04040 [Candidatus Limnocylindria bacterium]|nr:hypothetical protein [Candidatus Limnocylindria bacterium]